jgi:hypothetical protein
MHHQLRRQIERWPPVGSKCAENSQALTQINDLPASSDHYEPKAQSTTQMSSRLRYFSASSSPNPTPELVGNREAHIVGDNRRQAASRLIEQGHNPHRRGLRCSNTDFR